VSVFRPLWLDGVPTPEARKSTLGGPLPGVLAEYVLLSEAGALAYPEYLTPAQASTLPIAAVTAWVSLFEHGHLQPEETVLVQWSGGVSLFGLQLARALGSCNCVSGRLRYSFVIAFDMTISPYGLRVEGHADRHTSPGGSGCHAKRGCDLLVKLKADALSDDILAQTVKIHARRARYLLQLRQRCAFGL